MIKSIYAPYISPKLNYKNYSYPFGTLRYLKRKNKKYDSFNILLQYNDISMFLGKFDF